MTDNEPQSRAGRTEADVTGELRAFNRVVEAMQSLDPAARLKLLRTVITFFGIDHRLDSHSSGTHAAHHPASHTQPAPNSPPSTAAATFSEDRTISPKEFLLQKRPNSDVERMACLSYYLTHYRNTPHFKTLDLSKLNTEAAQTKFSNAAQAVDNATKAGLLVPATKGNKQISAAGELYVQALPDRAAAKDAIAHFRQRRRNKRSRGTTGVNGTPMEVADSSSEE